MNTLSIVGIGIVAAILCVLLRQVRPEYALLLSLATGVFIFLALFTDLLDVVGSIQSMLTRASIPGAYVEVLFKALGICFLTLLACDTCKDAGETAISAKIEMAGKVGVLLVSLPLFEQVLTLVYTLVQAGA
jgi:stage III sporulation protein AD